MAARTTLQRGVTPSFVADQVQQGEVDIDDVAEDEEPVVDAQVTAPGAAAAVAAASAACNCCCTRRTQAVTGHACARGRSAGERRSS
jgi:hypothetical protein